MTTTYWILIAVCILLIGGGLFFYKKIIIQRAKLTKAFQFMMTTNMTQKQIAKRVGISEKLLESVVKSQKFKDAFQEAKVVGKKKSKSKKRKYYVK